MCLRKFNIKYFLFILPVVGTVPKIGAQNLDLKENQISFDDYSIARQNKSPIWNYHVDRMIGREAHMQLNKNDLFRQSIPYNLNSPNQAQLFSSRMIKKYKEERFKQEVGLKTMKAIEELVCTSIEIGSSISSPIGSRIAGKLCDYSYSILEEEVKTSMRKEYLRRFKTDLKKMEEIFSKEDLENLKNKGYFALIETMNNKLNTTNDLLDGMPPEDQIYILHSRDKILAESFKNGYKVLDNILILQENEIDQNKIKIKNLTNSMFDLERLTMTNLSKIVETQSEIKIELEEINHRIGKSEIGNKLVQEFLFGKMSPDEKIIALKKGWLPNLDNEERKLLISENGILAKQKKLYDQIQTYLNGSQDVLNIGYNLGFDQEILNKLSIAANVGNNLFNSFQAFQSGNFLSALSFVSNLFGLGSAKDIAGERHQQILENMKEIYEGLSVLDTKVNELIKGQQTILSSQIAIYEAIVAISNQIEVNQIENIEKLDRIHSDIILNRLLVVEEAKRKYNSCYKCLLDDALQKVILDTSKGTYPTFKDLYIKFNSPGGKTDFITCYEIISDIYQSDRKNFNPIIFSLQSDSNDKNKGMINDFIKNIYQPSLTFIIKNLEIDSVNNLDSILISFVHPVKDVGGLDKKLQHLDLIYQESEFASKSSFIDLLAEPLSVGSILYHNTMISNFHYFFLVLKDEDRLEPLTAKEIIDRQTVPLKGRTFLKEALELTKIGIAQQALISGDVMLPSLIEAFDRVDTTRITLQDQAEAFQLLNSNFTLAYNFILYKIKKDLEKGGVSLISYKLAYENSDINFLHKALNYKWDAKFYTGDEINNNSERGWKLKVGKKYYLMPTVEEIEEGKFLYPNSLYELINSKDELINEIISYDIMSEIDQRDRELFNSIMLTDIKD